jgi:hypothetical protein
MISFGKQAQCASDRTVTKLIHEVEMGHFYYDQDKSTIPALNTLSIFKNGRRVIDFFINRRILQLSMKIDFHLLITRWQLPPNNQLSAFPCLLREYKMPRYKRQKT